MLHCYQCITLILNWVCLHPFVCHDVVFLAVNTTSLSKIKPYHDAQQDANNKDKDTITGMLHTSVG
jgi:hypothetical protein